MTKRPSSFILMILSDLRTAKNNAEDRFLIATAAFNTEPDDNKKTLLRGMLERAEATYAKAKSQYEAFIKEMNDYYK